MNEEILPEDIFDHRSRPRPNSNAIQSRRKIICGTVYFGASASLGLGDDAFSQKLAGGGGSTFIFTVNVYSSNVNTHKTTFLRKTRRFDVPLPYDSLLLLRLLTMGGRLINKLTVRRQTVNIIGRSKLCVEKFTKVSFTRFTLP